jgi:signal transduction histidine kinase
LHLTGQSGSWIESLVRVVLRTGQAASLGNGALLRSKSGALIPIDDNAAPIRDETGAINGVVIVFRDVTTRAEIEERIRESQRMEAVGRLAGGVAHDFNNLLTIVVGFADLSTTSSTDPAAREHAQAIRRAGDRASSLTGQLLAFSRKQAFQPEIFDLGRLVV